MVSDEAVTYILSASRGRLRGTWLSARCAQSTVRPVQVHGHGHLATSLCDCIAVEDEDEEDLKRTSLAEAAAVAATTAAHTTSSMPEDHEVVAHSQKLQPNPNDRCTRHDTTRHAGHTHMITLTENISDRYRERERE